MGGDADRFWHQTPYSFAIYMRGRVAAKADEHKGRLWLAYHTALLSRAAKLPEFDTLTRPSSGAVQTPARLKSEAMKLAATGWGVFTPAEKPDD